MAFCKQCGHKNPDDARFCENCGEPQQAKPAAAPSTPPSATDQAPLSASSAAFKGPSKRLLMMLAAGLVGLVLLGAAMAFLLAPEGASKETFGKAIDRILLANPNLLREQYCLQNFNYSEDSVLVNTADHRTQAWMGLLTQAGLYSGPETVTTQRGFFTQTRLRFSKTEAGRKATHLNMLCIADGLEVAEVLDFTQPERLGGTKVARVSVRLALRNPMPWTQTEQARQLDQTLANAFSGSARNAFVLMREDGKWAPISPSVLARAEAQSEGPARTQEGPGIFASLAALFGFGPSNPILGVWSFEVITGVTGRFEFHPDRIITNRGQDQVRYEIQDDRVLVYTIKDNQLILDVRVIDRDNLSMNLGGINLRLTRVK